MLKHESLTISTPSGDLRFDTTQFPAMHSFELLARLVKSIGPAMGALSSLDPKTDLMSAGPILMAGLSSLNPSEASKLVIDVLASTTVLVNNKMIPLNTQASIDLVFSGKLKMLFQVLGHALKVNFHDFLTESDPGQGDPETPTLSQ